MFEVHGLGLKLVGIRVNRDKIYDCGEAVQALGEFFNFVAQRHSIPVSDAIQFLHLRKQIFPIVAVNQESVNEAVEHVRDQSISIWDAMLWVTVKQARSAYIITENMKHASQS